MPTDYTELTIRIPTDQIVALRAASIAAGMPPCSDSTLMHAVVQAGVDSELSDLRRIAGMPA